jgi:DNA-binding transcriptional ArsR family regulator
VANWSFLTNHGRALLCIAQKPDIRLRDLASDLGITERHAYAIVTDLTDAGYVVKEKDGRRNRYQVQNHLALPELPDQGRAIGDVLDVLKEPQTKKKSTRKSR